MVPVLMSCYTVKLLYACFVIDAVYSPVPYQCDFCCNCSFFSQVLYGVTYTSSDACKHLNAVPAARHNILTCRLGTVLVIESHVLYLKV